MVGEPLYRAKSDLGHAGLESDNAPFNGCPPSTNFIAGKQSIPTGTRVPVDTTVMLTLVYR